MDELFELPVQIGDDTVLLPAELKVWGYSHRVLVTWEKQEIIFEPDEERNYRALMKIDTIIPPPQTIIKAITASIESAFK